MQDSRASIAKGKPEVEVVGRWVVFKEVQIMTTDNRPPNRNATIVQMHDHDHMSFAAIGRIYNITRQRANQIYKAALKKQRKEA